MRAGEREAGSRQRINKVDEDVASHVGGPADRDEIVRRLQVEVHSVHAGRRLHQIARDAGRVDVLIAARRQQALVGQGVERRSERPSQTTEPELKTPLGLLSIAF